jgi:hypothetical protein
MTNEKLWESYDKYATDLSNVSRQLAFAAGALSWFFKSPENIFSKEILTALRFIVIFFIADVLQYLLGALFIRIWTRRHEKIKYKETGTIKGDYSKPSWLDYPAEDELTKRRMESYRQALQSEKRDAFQGITKAMIILLIDTVFFAVHWRIARRAREANTAA